MTDTTPSPTPGEGFSENTVTEREQLYAEIIANPDDDTVRLAFADWLDEQPSSRPCGKCHGDARTMPQFFEDAWQWNAGDPCPKCEGTGTVPDTSDADRAEFVRVQCELSRRDELLRRGIQNSDVGRRVWLGKRLKELEQLHPEWRRAACPECGGEDHNDQSICETCGGTGDLFRVAVFDRSESSGVTRRIVRPRDVHFSRGFPDGVSCTLAELGREETVGGGVTNTWRRVFAPSPWASAVVTVTPVTRFVVTDLTIYPSGGNDTYYVGNLGWFPREYWKELDGHPTERSARDALALACGKLVRRLNPPTPLRGRVTPNE